MFNLLRTEELEKEDVLDLFNETDVDAVSISSMFHYNYLKKTTQN